MAFDNECDFAAGARIGDALPTENPDRMFEALPRSAGPPPERAEVRQRNIIVLQSTRPAGERSAKVMKSPRGASRGSGGVGAEARRGAR
jgi:hypothetical protein